MKRIIATLLAGAALLGLVGCGGGSSANNNQNTEPKDMCRSSTTPAAKRITSTI